MKIQAKEKCVSEKIPVDQPDSIPKNFTEKSLEKMGKIGKSVSEQIPVDQPDSIPIAPITKVFPDRTNQPPTYIYKIQILLKMHES